MSRLKRNIRTLRRGEKNNNKMSIISFPLMFCICWYFRYKHWLLIFWREIKKKIWSRHRRFSIVSSRFLFVIIFVFIIICCIIVQSGALDLLKELKNVPMTLELLQVTYHFTSRRFHLNLSNNTFSTFFFLCFYSRPGSACLWMLSGSKAQTKRWHRWPNLLSSPGRSFWVSRSHVSLML